MPLLADYGNLGENPDSIFSASKRVASYSLDNIAPSGSIEREFINAKKSAGDYSLKFLEFQNMILELYQNIELVLELPRPRTATEDFNYLQQIKFLGSSLNRAVLFFRTYIGSNIADLSKQDVLKLNEIIKKIKDYLAYLTNKEIEYNRSLGPTAPNMPSYGANTWQILFDSLNEFIRQIEIALFSYNQNDAANRTLQGAGRNFYGKKINNTRDIPTVYSRNIKNCPTKYLL